MNKNFKTNERELIKVATYFKRQSKKLMEEGKLGAEHQKVGEAVDRFIEQMNHHADARAFILTQRDELQRLVKDEASCPQCHKRDLLKRVGVETNEEGWKSNRYRCRRCNIEFTWNTPNNPWDMISYINAILQKLREKAAEPNVTDEERLTVGSSIAMMEQNLGKIKPVIEGHDVEYNQLQEREAEMDRLIHEMKNSLLIEKIKMDTWENRTH